MASIDGIATGFNTTQIVASLMAAERVPQNQLRSQKNALDRQQSAFNDLKNLYPEPSRRAQIPHYKDQ